MTHAEFSQAVMKEWGITPAKLYQSCYYRWYNYTTAVNGKSKLIGKYTLVDSKPMFILIKKDGTVKHLEVQEG